MNILDKDKLLDLCRLEEVTDKTFYMFYECGYSKVPAAEAYHGSWIWSEDLKLLFDCFNNVILNEFIKEAYCDCIDEELDLFSLFNYEETLSKVKKLCINKKNIDDIFKFNADRKIIYNRIALYIKDVISILKDNLDCNVTILNDYDSVLALVKEHNNGNIPGYKSKKECLEEDGYY